MKISEQTVKDVAKLAHLTLTDQELSHYQQQMTKIIGFIDQLQSVDVSSLTSSHWAPVRERQDLRQPSLDEADVVSNAPRSTGSSFAVPRIIESN